MHSKHTDSTQRVLGQIGTSEEDATREIGNKTIIREKEKTKNKNTTKKKTKKIYNWNTRRASIMTMLHCC